MVNVARRLRREPVRSLFHNAVPPDRRRMDKMAIESLFASTYNVKRYGVEFIHHRFSGPGCWCIRALIVCRAGVGAPALPLITYVQVRRFSRRE